MVHARCPVSVPVYPQWLCWRTPKAGFSLRSLPAGNGPGITINPSKITPGKARSQVNWIFVFRCRAGLAAGAGGESVGNEVPGPERGTGRSFAWKGENGWGNLWRWVVGGRSRVGEGGAKAVCSGLAFLPAPFRTILQRYVGRRRPFLPPTRGGGDMVLRSRVACRVPGRPDALLAFSRTFSSGEYFIFNCSILHEVKHKHYQHLFSVEVNSPIYHTSGPEYPAGTSIFPRQLAQDLPVDFPSNSSFILYNLSAVPKLPTLV